MESNQSNQCYYCNITVNTLTALTCNHRICPKCLLKLCLIYYTEEEQVTLKCLKCNSGELRTTPQNIYKICIETPYSEMKPLCKSHNKEEEDLYCINCEAFMCKLCFDSHRNIQAFANHQYNEIDSSINYTCSKHNSQFLYQCLQCSTPLCEVCKSADHKDHLTKTVASLNMTLTEGLKELKDLIDKMEIVKQNDILVKTLNEILNLNQNLKRNINYNQMKIVKILTGHSEGVSCLIRLQDGKIASGSADNTIKVWDPNNDYNCTKTLKGHNGNVTCLIQLQDGKIVSGSSDSTIRVWNPNDDYNCMKTLTGHSSSVNCLIQLQDGKIASGSGDSTIRVWNPNDDYNCIKTLTGHNHYVSCLIHLQDAKIASGSCDRTIKVWNPNDNYKCMKTLKGHSGYVFCLIQLQDGKIASGSEDKTIRVWDPKNNYCMKTLTGHRSHVSCLTQLQDGKIASGSGDETIRVWNPNDDYKCMNTLKGHGSSVSCLIQLQDGKIASASSSNLDDCGDSIRVWDDDNILE